MLAMIVFVSLVLTQQKICQHIGLGQLKYYGPSTSIKNKIPTVDQEQIEGNYVVKNTFYVDNEKIAGWGNRGHEKTTQEKEVNSVYHGSLTSEPIEIEWQVLIDINYQLTYFQELETEMYSPVFSEAVKALDSKEILIEGFVIPFDEVSDTVALSANPMASCFFCGRASPASVMSMYLRDKSKRFKVDDFKKFRGKLHLNYDDPNEYYYVLRDARVE